MRTTLIASLVAVAVAGGFSAVHAEDRVQRVSTAGLDLSNAEAAKALHARLRQAARDACGVGGYIIHTQQIEAQRECVEQALDDAVAKVDRPLLTALQQERRQTLTARGY